MICPVPVRRRGAVVVLSLMALLLLALGLRQVTHRRAVVRRGYDLSAATGDVRRLAEENRRLRLERSVLTNPDRIERLAVGMGMVRPTPDQIRLVRSPAMARAGGQERR